MLIKRDRFFVAVFCLVLTGLTSCFEPPDLSIVPKIEYKSLEFVELDGLGKDSLILRFEIQDGDGNIGLTSSEFFPPFHDFDFIIDERDSLVEFGDPDVVPPFRKIDPYATIITPFSDTDTRPPFNCKDYYLVNEDTFYIHKNEYHNNLHIAFFIKDLMTGEFSEIDFSTLFGNSECNSLNFDSRIPVFDDNLIGEPLQGVFSYFMTSDGFLIAFSNQTFKVRFYIYDRALNQSNIIETPEVTLFDITR